MVPTPSQERKLVLITEALQWYAAHLEEEARRCRAQGMNRHAEATDARARECLAILEAGPENDPDES